MAQDEDYDEGTNEGGGDGGTKVILFVLSLIAGILFLPSLIITFMFYAGLRWGRQRPSVSLTAALTILVGVVLSWQVFKPLEALPEVVNNLDELPGSLWSVAPLIIIANLVVGTLLGLGIVLWEHRQMKTNPHRLAIPGAWTYKFKYRRTPLQLLRRKRKVVGLKQGKFLESKLSPLGISEEGDDTVVSRHHAEAAKHTLVVGGSGSGKSITLQSLILSDIQNGVPINILDLKASPQFASKVAAWAAEYDRPFYHFCNGDPEDYDIENSPGQAYYDVLKAGSATSKADMILSLREFDTASEVYKKNLTQVLQVTFAMLKFARARRDHPALQMSGFFDAKGRRVYDTEEFCNRAEIKPILEKERQEFMLKNSRNKGGTFNEVARLLDLGVLKNAKMSRIDWDHGGIYQLSTAVYGDNLEYLCQACVGTPIESEALELRNLLDRRVAAGAGIRNAVTELQGQMRTIIASEYGQWLKTSPDGERSIDLLKMSKSKGTVVLFSLNSDSEPEFAKYIGSLIMADITNVSAKRRAKQIDNLVGVYIDEFQALNPTSVSSLLEKSRESKIAMTLAQQSFEQIVKSSSNNGEAYLLSVLDTCSNFIVHAGMTEDSAERLSKILGKEYVTTYKVSNRNKSFFLSNNWSNKRNQVVQTAQEEQWVFAPSRFMNLTSPDPSANGNKSTAILVNKTSSAEKFRGKAGASAQEVWMIPDARVIANYYVSEDDDEDDTVKHDDQEVVPALSGNPLFDDEDEVENEVVEDDFEYDNSDEGDFYDKDDGSFAFEELIEESESDQLDDEGMLTFNEEQINTFDDVDVDTPEEESPQPRVRRKLSVPVQQEEEPARRESSFAKLTQENNRYSAQDEPVREEPVPEKKTLPTVRRAVRENELVKEESKPTGLPSLKSLPKLPR